MSAIRKFFEKRKLDFKFKTAGSGQKLSAKAERPSSSKQHAPMSARAGPSSESQVAAMAAITRVEQKKAGMLLFFPSDLLYKKRMEKVK